MKTLQVTLLCAFLAVLSACALPFLALMKPLEAGTPAPAFTLSSVNGETVALSDLEGQLVLLNFWIPTWKHCLDELPVLATLEKEFATKGLAVVTVCMGVSAEEARQALRKANVDLRTLVDEDTETASPYRVGGTPTTYLIDGAGVIVTSSVGYGDDTEDSLRAEIQHLLEE